MNVTAALVAFTRKIRPVVAVKGVLLTNVIVSVIFGWLTRKIVCQRRDAVPNVLESSVSAVRFPSTVDCAPKLKFPAIEIS